MEQKNDTNKTSIDSDINDLFDSLVTKGAIELEETVFPGFTVKLKPLNASEQLLAESRIQLANDPNAPRDVVQRARSIALLVAATVSINGRYIDLDNAKDEENRERRQALHRNLLKMPANRIDDIFNFYMRVVAKQDEIYRNPKELAQTAENF